MLVMFDVTDLTKVARHDREGSSIRAASLGSGAGDLGQAAVGGAVPSEAVVECHDVAGPAGPLPHQDGAGPDGACVRDRQLDLGAGDFRLGDLIEVASRGGIEVAMRCRLQLIGQEGIVTGSVVGSAGPA